MKLGFLYCVFFCLPFCLQAQVGPLKIGQMNALLQKYGGDNPSTLKYEASTGTVRQEIVGFSERYALPEIKRIVAQTANESSSVVFFCDEADPCVSQMGSSNQGRYVANVSYFFTSEQAANFFAVLAAEIIEQDFKTKPTLLLTDESEEVGTVVTEPKPKPVAFDVAPPPAPSKSKPAQAEAPAKPKPKKDPLALSSYEEYDQGADREETDPVTDEFDGPVKTKKKLAQETAATPKPKKDPLALSSYEEYNQGADLKNLSAFGQKMNQLLQLAGQHQLASIKDGQSNGVMQSKIKLPKAKRNYLNEYKGADCFVAEFGTKEYYEDLEQLYNELKDEIEASLPEGYEPTDMAYESVYENSNDEIFHTEYYNVENLASPSIMIRIAPDGKANTLFIRIGKR